MSPGNTSKTPSSPGKVALIGAAATALAIFNIMSGSEAPSPGIAILQYVFLAGGLLGLAGGLFMMAAQK